MNSLRSAWTAVLAGLPDAMIRAKASCEGACPGNGHYHEKRILTQNRAHYQRNIRLAFIDPGKPIQNAFVESFNGRMRDECLNANWFLNVADARRKILAWRQDFNQQRPHSALGYRTPREYAASLRTSFNQETYIPDGT